MLYIDIILSLTSLVVPGTIIYLLRLDNLNSVKRAYKILIVYYLLVGISKVYLNYKELYYFIDAIIVTIFGEKVLTRWMIKNIKRKKKTRSLKY